MEKFPVARINPRNEKEDLNSFAFFMFKLESCVRPVSI